jgi:hypothetical protein
MSKQANWQFDGPFLALTRHKWYGKFASHQSKAYKQFTILMNKMFHCAAVLLLLSTLNARLSTAYAQGAAFTYQGRVTDNGTNFTGTGQFEFALVTSTNASRTATATANAPSGGYITGYAVTSDGNGYTGTTAAVMVTGGGGSGAAAHANISGGAVVSISVDNTGNGLYTNAPTVTIAPPPESLSYTTYWSNDGTSVNGSEPVSAVNVGVSSGLFTVVLGDISQLNMTVINDSIFTQPNLQLRIWFSDGVNGFAALDPAQNLTPTPYATIANTALNLDNGLTIQNNTNGAPDVVGGSSVNYISGNVVGATIAGGGAPNSFNQGYSNSVTANFGTIGGGAANTAGGPDGFATVGGGLDNNANNDYATVGGGDENTASGWASTVGGGNLNTASSPDGSATVGGGYNNTASGDSSTVGGGSYSSASGNWSTAAGGAGSQAYGDYSAVGGGYDNNASGYAATVPGGYENTASGIYSFASGYGAQASQNYSFVWSDYEGIFNNFASTTANQFAVRASGGILFAGDVQLAGGANAYHNLSLSGGNALGYLYGSFPALGDGIHLGYNYYYDASGNGHVANTGGATSRLTAGYGFVGIYIGAVNGAPGTQRLLANSSGVTVNGTFNNSSDRNLKQDFAAISPAQMLEKVGQLPITEWSYKEDPTTRHVGPVAQDFYSVFNIGTDDKHIAPIDEGGVALAAIQGLNQKLEQKETEITELKARLEKLEQLVNNQNGGSK